MFYRLESPFENNSSAWMVVSEDQKEALAVYFRVLQPTQAGFKRIRLAGLRADWEYSVEEVSGAGSLSKERNGRFGDELMYAGLSVSDVSSGLPGVAEEKHQGFSAGESKNFTAEHMKSMPQDMGIWILPTGKKFTRSFGS